MRTTLTLDDDVAAGLERTRRARGLGLRAAVNEAMRRGLATMGADEAPRPIFVTRSATLGAARLPLDDVAEALASAEREDFR